MITKALRKRILKEIRSRFRGPRGGADFKRFARFVGVSEGALLKWLYDDRRPRYKTMKTIEELTEGAIKVGDWN